MKLLALAALTLFVAARAYAVEESTLKREDWRVLGWNDACAAALETKAYPKLGMGIQEDPAETHIGTLTIDAGQETFQLSWNLELDGAYSWEERQAASTEKDLQDAGYVRPGFHEDVRAEVGNQPGLAEVLQSTTTLGTRLKKGWPGRGWRLSGVDFNPLSTCALLAYAPRRGGLRHQFLLVRVYDSRARLERARAHTENALLLFAKGDVDTAAAEAATGAALAPELPVSRYHNAALQTLTGHIEDAVSELSAAIKLDPKLRAKARDDQDFDALRVRDDFQDLVREP